MEIEKEIRQVEKHRLEPLQLFISGLCSLMETKKISGNVSRYVAVAAGPGLNLSLFPFS
jgi:hypothetical protein